MSKKDLIVASIDENYVDQAKQLFSSIYFNGEWKGDVMLLAQNLNDEDINWFKKRGILIKNVNPLFNKNVGRFPSSIFNKFYLFANEFKRWNKILYLDSDIIVKGSLKGILKYEGFCAVEDLGGTYKLKDSVKDIKNLNSSNELKCLEKLKNNYDLKQQSFNAGVFIFDSQIIKNSDFESLKKLMNNYVSISLLGDQLIINLHFYDNWNKLDKTYNHMIFDKENLCVDLKNNNSIIWHFISRNKPWITKSDYYTEWKHYLDKADEINFMRNGI